MSPAPDTSLCGILLHPAGHTRSPAMHRAAYALLGIDADYQVFDVRPEGLAAKLRELRGVGARQLSISLPHKENMQRACRAAARWCWEPGVQPAPSSTDCCGEVPA